MNDDVYYEPLALYRDQLKAEHADNTAACFEELIKRSGVDERANTATIASIRALDVQLIAADSSRFKWRTLRRLVIILVVAAFIVLALFVFPGLSPDMDFPLRVHGLWAAVCAAVAAGGIALIVAKLNPTIRVLDDRRRFLSECREAKMAEARTQLAPLNRLYDWGMIARLIQKTVPHLVLDPYFSRARLDELHHACGWDDCFNHDKSVICAQSGDIHGNPFVLAETLDFRMSMETYHGSLTIFWKECENCTASDGRTQTRWVTRIQTLHASVDKPAPKYNSNKFIVYGNETAPDLTFSRTPSDLFAADGLLDKRRMKHTVAKLEALSRKLEDHSAYTIMSNRQFDALFHATDRNDELQFRLLFTPLAQQQMVNLLYDKTVGFGDDFTFVKSRKVNIIMPVHLAGTDFTADPSIFQNHDLVAARESFNAYSNTYFRALYFGLAPLLSIPLYQQHRSHADICEDVTGRTASFWEYEAIANFHGQEAFKHSESITENILKTHHTRAGDGCTEVDITAYGFRGEERVEHILTLGGDGHLHNVPVTWIEYLPVQRTSTLIVRETDGFSLQDCEQQLPSSTDWRSFFRQWRTEPQNVTFRRSIVSFLASGPARSPSDGVQ